MLRLCHLLIIFFLVFVDLECLFFIHISVSRFLLLYFSLNTQEKLLHLWQVARRFPPLCTQFVYYCIIWHFESSAASTKLLSAADAKNIHYNTSQHASESTSNHRESISSHCSFLFCIFIQQEECKTKGNLLENNALIKCCKTCDSLWRSCEIQSCVMNNISEACSSSSPLPNIFQVASFFSLWLP